MTDLTKLKLYATRPHSCSYLPDKDATTVFIDPIAEIDADIYSELSRYGFRRSGSNIYRPHCDECQACVPIRLIVDDFKPNRSQRRCIKANTDLAITTVESISTEEHYSLYETYINERHADGDMYPASYEQYSDFLTAEWGVTRFIEMRDQDAKLVAVAVTDRLDHGLSAAYTFFDPALTNRSLGTFGILYQIQLARELQLPFAYLGYWIRKCQKMNYKTQYQPYQVLINQAWVTVTDYPPENGAKTQLL
ncbi:arginyltransferase [Teredinibacter haidensis]|uniref:arginyltransferase n=1 Tax=Teredinibacter haidensis TaxID=2731755 RepID=UPI0009491EB4|nr:arginyltransferase [Teredinibacter haidensis]